jgi:hypothetical protein
MPRRSTCTAGRVGRTLLCRSTDPCDTQEAEDMTTTALGMPKATLVRGLGASAVLFGGAGLLAPRALGAVYAVPSTPHTRQLLRLFGSRMLALAAWTLTARTQEEVDRVLAVAAGLNAVDALTALAASGGTGRAAGLRAAATSGTFGALALVVRSLDD